MAAPRKPKTPKTPAAPRKLRKPAKVDARPVTAADASAKEVEGEVIDAAPVERVPEGLDAEPAEPALDGEPAPEELEDVDVATPAPSSSALIRAPGPGEISRRDPMQAFMAEVNRHPLLTREEEHDLAVNYVKTQDVKAAYKLVAANLRLVVKLAHEYHRNPLALLDLIQEGNIGLMQAVKKYDPYRGVKLSSYAAWWIRAYILRYIMDN
ncbi:MAG: sigma-70 family RNA polymerase sigma factor, partial [Myxococcaceae bacterium]